MERNMVHMKVGQKKIQHILYEYAKKRVTRPTQ